MANIITQEEIDTLLDICDDEEYESGSPEFEKVLQDMKEDKITTPCGNNPSEIMESLKNMRKSTYKRLRNLKNLKYIIKKYKR